MKTAALALAALLLGSAPSARAEEKKPSFSFSGFFKNLKHSLEQSAVAAQRKKGRGAAVAAVRGASQSSELANPDEPTLKGDSRSRRLAKKAAEDAELLKATELVEEGKTAEALAAFKAFQKKHPRSHKEDVAKAIAELSKAAPDAQLAAAPAAEPGETAEAAAPAAEAKAERAAAQAPAEKKAEAAAPASGAAPAAPAAEATDEKPKN